MSCQEMSIFAPSLGSQSLIPSRGSSPATRPGDSWIQIPIPSFTSSVTLNIWFNFSLSQFPCL